MAQPCHVDYYTSSRNHSDVDVVMRQLSSPSGRIHCGEVRVTAWVWGYRKISHRNGAVLEMCEFHSLPPLTFDTRGVWIDLQPVGGCALAFPFPLPADRSIAHF